MERARATEQQIIKYIAFQMVLSNTVRNKARESKGEDRKCWQRLGGVNGLEF